MEQDQIEAFQKLERGMQMFPHSVFKGMFSYQMKDVIKKRLKNKETPDSIYNYFTDEPTVVRILSYCQIDLDTFRSWIK
jgi:hypothetical protein